MTLRDKAFLVWHYGKAQLIIGGVYNILSTQLLLHRVSYAFFVNMFIIKAIVYAISLHKAFKLFGVNYCAFVNRFPKYTRYRNSSIWELSDGYTAPVHSREDLVRHGYLR